MTTLVKNTVCVKHTPFIPAISTVSVGYDAEQFTFCENCEQNIERSSFEDSDRGNVWTKWVVSK